MTNPLELIEKDIADTLGQLAFGGGPLFRAITGRSGPVRAALLQSLQRERVPAAGIVFLNEKLTPEAPATEKGPRFAILLLARRLRAGANPREDESGGAAGGYTLINETRAALDDHTIDPPGVTLKPLAAHAIESDDRHVIYQVTYICRYP